MKTSNTYLLILTLLIISFHSSAKPLTVERLTWAGVKIANDNTTVFIDPIGRNIWGDKIPQKLVQVTSTTRRRYALISHLHNDHFDVQTLKQVLGERGYVICHESVSNYIASQGLKVISTKTYEPVMRGGMIFTPVPAEDGLGEEQVSWVIKADNKSFFHAGDTLWHGKWQTIGLQYGPFEAAFLPINGARFPGQPESETPFVMTPQQAVDAAIALKAKKLVPIHFGLNDPENYIEIKNALNQTLANAKRRNLKIEHLLPGEQLSTQVSH